jgi:uncharacterized membrane protein
MIVIPNQTLYYLMMFVIGFIKPMKTDIAFTHMMEFIPGKESLVSGLLFCIEGLVYILSPLILLFLTKDAMVFLYICLAINIISMVVFTRVYFPESVKYSLVKGDYNRVQFDLNYIFTIN